MHTPISYTEQIRAKRTLLRDQIKSCIFAGYLKDPKAHTIAAQDLHSFIGTPTKFKAWILQCIFRTKAKEGKDLYTFQHPDVGDLPGDVDYLLTMQTAIKITKQQGSLPEEVAHAEFLRLVLPTIEEIKFIGVKKPKKATSTGMSLIQVSKNIMGKQVVDSIDARELHAFLGVGRDFSNWITGRIEGYSFKVGEDYIPLAKLGEAQPCTSGTSSSNKQDYALSMDMASELCMVEHSKKGKEARKYFLECARLRAENEWDSTPPRNLKKEAPKTKIDAEM